MVQTEPLRPEVELRVVGDQRHWDLAMFIRNRVDMSPTPVCMGYHMFQTALQLCGLQDFRVLGRGDFPLLPAYGAKAISS